MKKLYLKFVNKGVANRFDLGDHELIEMNWRLKLYPDLFNHVLMHEINHSDGKTDIKDLAHDLTSRTPGLWRFMCNHISAWTQLLPLYWDSRRKSFVYDCNTIISFMLLIAMTITTYCIIGWTLYIIRNGIF